MACQYLNREALPKLAFVHSQGRSDVDAPCIIFCGGYRSDMQGTKATYFEAQAQARGQSYLRFDYSGHGQSGGEFIDGTIGSWLEDALAIFDHCIGNQKAIIIGSSMGGWLGLLLAQARAAQVAGYIGIAAAPDFTEHVYHHELTQEQHAVLENDGILYAPNDYSDEPYSFTKALFEDGKTRCVLNQDHHVTFPIRLFHGQLDTDVPESSAHEICAHYHGDVKLKLVKDGDHLLSRTQDLEMIEKEIIALSKL